jgi:hypothetical protein
MVVFLAVGRRPRSNDHVANNIIVPAFFGGLAAWVIFPVAALMAGGLLCSAFHFSASKP